MADRPAVLITGAASGIGRAVAERCADDGWDVLSGDLEIEDAVGVGFAGDLTSAAANRGAVAAARERFGRLDAIVANAGVQHVAPIATFAEERWRQLIDLMLTSPFLLAQEAWPLLAQAPAGGRFIAIASAHGLVASPHKSAYVAAKHGVLGLIKTLALEGAQEGILASAVCPAFVRTALVERQLADRAEQEGISEDAALEALLAPHVVKRLLEPEEVAATVAFLLGDGGRAFTGAAVPMDLGWTAR